MLTAHELLGFMSQALALEILSYAYESDKPLYHATLTAVAEARKLRPVFLERQPRAERHVTMLAALSVHGGTCSFPQFRYELPTCDSRIVVSARISKPHCRVRSQKA